ncbi:hypothetical protein C8Q80DRAFT_1124848 [Daedaleopsis nitida]|nr:hypothetical protein C8Q80DRAFT_1124848 [Daedaleopsis nitida]
MNKNTLKKKFLQRSLSQSLIAPETVTVTAPKAPVVPVTEAEDPDPTFPGGLACLSEAPTPAPMLTPAEAAAAHLEAQAKKIEGLVGQLSACPLDAEAAHFLKAYQAMKFQGELRPSYHANEAALDAAAETQPARENYRALDRAQLAKHERAVDKNTREAAERAVREKEAAECRARAEERRREEEARKREEEEIRRISEAHRREVEYRLYQEERQRRFEQERRELAEKREREERERQARLAEQRKKQEEEEARRRRLAEERQRARERRELEEELRRARQEREDARRYAQQQEEIARRAVEEQRRTDLEALRNATRAVYEKLAQLERDHAAAEAMAQAAARRAELMEQELRARDAREWAQVQFFQQALAQAVREQEALERTLREEHARAAAEAQRRIFLEQQQQAAAFEAQQRAEQARREQEERAAREAQEKAAREAEERAQQSAREFAQAQARRAKEFCDTYDHKWTVLKNEKKLVDVVPYAEFPLPAFPILANINDPFPPNAAPDSYTLEQVWAFLFNEQRTSMAGKSRKERIKAEMLRWHPDKFEGQVMRKIRPEDKETMRQAVGVIARILNNIKEQVNGEDS